MVKTQLTFLAAIGGRGKEFTAVDAAAPSISPAYSPDLIRKNCQGTDMLSELKLLRSAQLEKAAIDAGFDVVGAIANNVMSFRSSQCPLRIWLGMAGAQPLVGLSMANVVAELNRSLIDVGIGIDGCAAWTAATDFVDLDRLLARAFALAGALPNQLLDSWSKQVQSLSGTEREALVRQRVGQDLFRDGLLALWAGRCAITGLDEPALLRASHAKPWKEANDAERLDVYNGLLLAAHLDAAFDKGLITLGSDGTVIWSPKLSPMSLSILGCAGDAPKLCLRSAHQPYMEWHRVHVFQK